MLWLALGNLFLMLECLAQPEYRGISYGSLIWHALMTPKGDLPFLKGYIRGEVDEDGGEKREGNGKKGWRRGLVWIKNKLIKLKIKKRVTHK